MPGKRRADAAALPPSLRPRRKPALALPAPEHSASLLVRLAPERTALFRFFLEAHEHLAYFTVLEHKTALLRLIFSPHRERETREVLARMAQSLPFSVEEWPTAATAHGPSPRAVDESPAPAGATAAKSL